MPQLTRATSTRDYLFAHSANIDRQYEQVMRGIETRTIPIPSFVRMGAYGTPPWPEEHRANGERYFSRYALPHNVEGTLPPRSEADVLLSEIEAPIPPVRPTRQVSAATPYHQYIEHHSVGREASGYSHSPSSSVIDVYSSF